MSRSSVGEAARPPWTCPQCGRVFLAKNARHSCVSRTPASVFAPHPEVLPLVDAVHARLRRFGEVEMEATRTQVSFRARRRFAYLWMPSLVRKRGPPELWLTFDLTRPVASPRLRDVVEPRSGLFTHHLPFRAERELDDEVEAWLRESFETRGR